MMSEGSYGDYAQAVLAVYEERPAAERNLLFNAVIDESPRRVLDLGCGPGQELIPFLENSRAVCVGVDIGEDLANIALPFHESKGFAERANFVRAPGELLPFADATFDVVLCRVALPYMNNRRTIAEVARVLALGGTFLLKTHAPPFYVAMLRERVKTGSVKQIAYPVICLAGSIWHMVSGGQLAGGVWQGKEVFQTRRYLDREMAKHGLQIVGELADTNRQTPSFRIIKAAAKS